MKEEVFGVGGERDFHAEGGLGRFRREVAMTRFEGVGVEGGGGVIRMESRVGGRTFELARRLKVEVGVSGAGFEGGVQFLELAEEREMMEGERSKG